MNSGFGNRSIVELVRSTVLDVDGKMPSASAAAPGESSQRRLRLPVRRLVLVWVEPGRSTSLPFQHRSCL